MKTHKKPSAALNQPPKALEPEVLPADGPVRAKKQTLTGSAKKKPAAKKSAPVGRKSAKSVPSSVSYEDLEDQDEDSDDQAEEVDGQSARGSGSSADSDDVDPSDEEIQASSKGIKKFDSPEVVTLEPEMRAVSSTDPLRRYLEEVRRHPMLAPEEEFRLAQRLRDSGDIEAAKTLVAANLRLVVKIAFEYRNFYNNTLDLIQEGNVGLMKAVSKFDPTKGARLGYYASWWIRSYILKYLLDNFRLVKIGTTQAQKKLFYHLMREKQRLEAQGMMAGPKLLAEKLEVREKDVIEMSLRLGSSGAEMSLDAPVDPETGATTRLDFLADDHEGADESLARQELLRLLKDKLPDFEKELGEKELRILKERLLSDEPKTLQEVADNYGLTRERARQIEVKVLQKLRKFLAPFLGTMGEEDED